MSRKLTGVELDAEQQLLIALLACHGGSAGMDILVADMNGWIEQYGQPTDESVAAWANGEGRIDYELGRAVNNARMAAESGPAAKEKP